MNIRTTRHLLWAVAAAMAASALAVGAAGFLCNFDLHGSMSTPRGRVRSERAGAAALPPLAAFEPLWDLDLRRPLFDPAPVQPAPLATVAPPTLSVRLVGTVTEVGHSQALLMTPEGKLEIRGIGEQSGGAEILAIDEAGITVRFAGQTLVLKNAGKP